MKVGEIFFEDVWSALKFNHLSDNNKVPIF